jgi:cobyrinic acid a,c-diamide synthase
MSDLYVSAAHKSSGKTVVTLGLCAALRERGVRVAPYKKGPDYIDAGWLAYAAGQACYNLDFNTMGVDEIKACFDASANSADIAVIEGTKGLHDGVKTDGSDSNAALVSLLQTPVLLVIDARGMTRGVAALLLGLQTFAPQLRFAGVILNRVGGMRHGTKLRAAVETYSDCPVLGLVPEQAALGITERHLGLMPGRESKDVETWLARVVEVIEDSVDVSALAPKEVGRALAPPMTVSARDRGRLRLAVARDAAFNFYYADDLEALSHADVEICFFDTLRDAKVPEADALWLGGGFPETAMNTLGDNVGMRESIQDFARTKRPIYAECGGLMYLARTLTWGERRKAMCGVLPIDIEMRERPQGRGYMQLKETGAAPWGRIVGADALLPAHEFHYSCIAPASQSGLQFAYEVTRGFGADGQHDGIVYGSVFATYAHLRNTRRSPWIDAFVGWIRRATSNIEAYHV